MTRVYWAFGRTSFETYQEFVVAVTDYNNDINPGNHAWNPNAALAEGPIRVIYEAMWKDEDDVIELWIGDGTGPVTMGQVLFQLNQDTMDFWGEHPGFFEGLTCVEGNTYRMAIGT